MIEKTSECPRVRDELVTSGVDLQNGGDENGGSGDDVIRPTTNASAKDALLTLSRNTQVRCSWVKWGRYRSIEAPHCIGIKLSKYQSIDRRLDG